MSTYFRPTEPISLNKIKKLKELKVIFDKEQDTEILFDGTNYVHFDCDKNKLTNIECLKINMLQNKLVMIFINIVNGETLLGCHILIIKNTIWERLAPVGSPININADLMDSVIKTTYYADIDNYYTPTSCPVLEHEASITLRQLYCEIWDMWYLYDRIQNKGYSQKWRETMYPITIARTLMYPDTFKNFLIKFITNMSDIKQNVTVLTGHTTDDILSQILN